MDWHEGLPDASKWQPDAGREETLSAGLLFTCQAAQSRIIAEAAVERRFNVNNFDSGPGVEDVVRQELAKLLPDRYRIDPGVVSDRDGRTAGDCDILIRDGTWSPVTKLGATPASRRYHFAVESIYSAIEVKQTLGFRELDAAMEKLVKISRLRRPDNPYGHITENQHLTVFDRDGWILNPLHTVVLGTAIHPGVDFRDIVHRFHAINSSLERGDVVTMLCVLGQGSAWFSVIDSGTVDATFMWDRGEPLQLSIHDADEDRDNTFYRMFAHLLGHLARSVLLTANLSEAYGAKPAPYVNYRLDDARYNRDAGAQP